MTGNAWVYLLFSAALAAVFAGIVLYYYSRRRRDRVEAPKYRMLDDDGQP
jgi:cbb3-type cytochrome oxidase subunit 3